jgi:hypothetical protein
MGISKEKMMQKYFKMLGYECQDVVTDAKGIADSISFDVYGCVQISLRPKVDKDGKHKEGHWYDAKRLKIVGKKPVIEQPDFCIEAGQEIGPSEKPNFKSSINNRS